ncbi:MAG: hypothetical protein JXM69_00770 [Anaerolineae bacterium]|nr:hypothetical protein [Anaerolineae bacterium]
MKSEIKLSSPNWKISIVVGFFVTVLIIFLSLVFRVEFGVILLSVAGSIAGIGLVAIVGKVVSLLYWREFKRLELETARQELRLTTFKADRAQLEAFVISIPKTQRVITRPDSPIRVIEALPEPAHALLPATTHELDLLTVFTQPTQSYACVGGQQTGKTYQMRHIAQHWLNNGSRPIVVGPKWDRGEWAGCLLFGGMGDFAEVSKGITIVRQEAQRRHADLDRLHKDHSILPVFFDDWTPIVDAVDNARELVLQATTLYASVNIILYFILHSDTANAWGVDRKGAALKDNFIKLFIVPHYDANGLIVREKTRGYVKFAGDNQEYPVKLFNTPLVTTYTPILETEEYINLEVEPTPTEAYILNLHGRGYSHARICEHVYGYKSSNKYPEIDRVLAKFGACNVQNTLARPLCTPLHDAREDVG